MSKNKGRLIIIGGHEDKDHDRVILKHVAAEVQRLGGSLVLVTIATDQPEETIDSYVPVFESLGIPNIEVLDVRERSDGFNTDNVDKIADNSVVFFTGGDQLRITSQFGDSPLYQRMMRAAGNGATIVGTSAGAAAMPETMIVSGPSDESATRTTLAMASGLGLLPGVVIDSHFSQRGRIVRLLSTIAQNPRNLGVGIDEDTAIVVERGKDFRIIGCGGVYVLDGSSIRSSSVSDKSADAVISICNVTLHVLSSGDCFDLVRREAELKAR